MPRKKNKYEELPSKPCPNCNELVMEDAKVCDYCGYRFEPEGEPAPVSKDAALMSELFDQLSEPTPKAEEPVIDMPEEPVEEPVQDVTAEELEPEPVGELVAEEIPPEDDTPRCPNCGAVVDEGATHCQACGYQLRAEEVTPKAPLQGLETEFTLAPRDNVDFSKAVPGERTIVRPTEDGKYEAVMAPKDIPIEVIYVDEKEAEMLKADYTLRIVEEIKIKDIVEAGWTLNNSPEYLKKYFGSVDIDEIYGEGLSNYADVKGTKVSLLTSGVSVSTLQILQNLKAGEQDTLAQILADYEVRDLTRISARRIVESDRSVEEMRKIVLEESLIRNVVREMNAE